MFYARERSSMVFISSLWTADVTIPTNIPGDSLHINHWKGKTRLILKQTWSSDQVYTDFSLPRCPWTIFSIFLQDTLYFLDLSEELMMNPWFKSSAKYLGWLAKTGKNYWLQLKYNPPKLCNRPQEMLSCSVLKDSSAQTAPLSSRTSAKGLCLPEAPSSLGCPGSRGTWHSPMPITFSIAVWHRDCTVSCHYFATGFPDTALICWNNIQGHFSTQKELLF